MHPSEDESSSSSSDDDSSSEEEEEENEEVKEGAVRSVPQQDSSSEDEDEEEEDNAKVEGGAVRTVPRPDSSSEEEEEEDEEEKEEEEEENQEMMEVAVRSVPHPDSSSEDEDDEEDTPDQEREPNDTMMAKARLEPASVPQRESKDAAMKGVLVRKDDDSSKKRPLDEYQAVESVKRKKDDNQTANETKKQGFFNKVWSTEDEKNLISYFHEFVVKNPGSRKDIAGFFKLWDARVGKFGKRQVEDKLRRLKEKYLKRQNTEKRGESCKDFPGSLERDIYVLSKEIWGLKEGENMEEGEKENWTDSDKHGNKGKRKEESAKEKENSKTVKDNSQKKKGKVTSNKVDVRSPKSTITTAEKEEVCLKEQEKRKEVKQPKSDGKILKGGGEDMMRSWSMLFDTISNPVGFRESLGVEVTSLRELKESGLEASQRKLNEMRSMIEEKQAEVTFERLALAVKVMEAVRSASEKGEVFGTYL